MIAEILNHIFGSMTEFLTMLIILGLIVTFSMQIVAWVTPPKPKFVRALALGLVIGVINTWALYYFLPIAPSLINGAINGIYGNWGYIWAGGLIWMVSVFIMNAWTSWSSNRPLEVIQ